LLTSDTLAAPSIVTESTKAFTSDIDSTLLKVSRASVLQIWALIITVMGAIIATVVKFGFFANSSG
ncbi:MAG: hypothetical protein ACKO5Q_20295, partial [Microcystaceae cyanobacterium]